jgi:Ca2+-binding RTX toxin-like protein
MARRVSDIDSDPLDLPAEPIARPRPAAIPAEQPAPDQPAADGGTTQSPGPFNPALDDIVVDLDGGVYAPVPPDLVIHGTTGDDVLYGGAGNDVMRGLAGNDVIFGGAGNDSISGDAGNDLIFGGLGNDHINGNAGDDVLHGDAGNDSLWGADGNDVLKGGDGDDRLEGGAGNDKLYGGNGNDTLRGGDGDDMISGGDGRDVIDGGKGQDTLTGGAGRDFFMARPDDVVWNGHSSQWDIITDFNPYGSTDRDCIDLRLIMAQTEFTGTTAQEAYEQGYLRLSQYQHIDDYGNVTHGTLVVVDKNGHAPQSHGVGVANVFVLEGVQTHELSFTAFAGHFLV